MAYVLSVEETIERSLRQIGAFAIRSSGARPEEVKEARYWLDFIVGHEASRQRAWWLVPASATFPVAAGSGAAPADLTALVGSAQAPNGIQFIIGAVLYDTVTGLDIHELPIVRRQEWEQRTLLPGVGLDGWQTRSLIDSPPSPSPPDPPGTPSFCYIDRGQKPSFQCYPTADKVRSYGVRLLFQGYASDFVGIAANSRQHSLRAAWNLWTVTALSAELADGPIRKAPADEVAEFRQRAMVLRNELEEYENQEVSQDRRIQYFNGI